MPPPPHLARFADLARRYCVWCLSKPAEPEDEALTLLRYLASLYRGALDLTQAVELTDAEAAGVDDVTWNRVFRRAGQALPFTHYNEHLEPHDVPSHSVGIGDLADDVADIYRDLMEGLELFERGEFASAEWRFRLGLESHWGAHATSAIHALHEWLHHR